MMEIDFYHIDSFEVSVFLPIYHYLETVGIKPRPVLPSDSISTAAVSYLDIVECKKFYKEHKIEFYDNPNYGNPVCTTQGSEFLSLYTNLRIRIPYGPGIDPCGWGLTRKSTIGFDHILVHGQYYRDYLSYFISINKIHVAGYPRYDLFFNSDLKNKRKPYAPFTNLDKRLKTIFMLPTWGEASSLNSLLEISLKINCQYNILLKPHHLSLSRDSDLLEKYKDSGVMVLRDSNSLVEAFFSSDIVICDIKSCAFSESILTNKKTIGLALNRDDWQWVHDKELNKISYIVQDMTDLMECIEKYTERDEFIVSRNLWIQDKVDINDGFSSLTTATILKECLNSLVIPLHRKILRICFASVFSNKWIDQRLSTRIISRCHWLIIKCLGNFK